MTSASSLPIKNKKVSGEEHWLQKNPPRPQDRRDLLDDQKAHKPVAEQGDIRRPKVAKLDHIQKANKLVAEYNSKRKAYALDKPNGNYFASLLCLEIDPIELKTNTAAASGEGIGIGQIGRGAENTWSGSTRTRAGSG